MVYTLSVTRAFPLLGLEAGDTVIMEPGAPEPVVLYRPLPANFGAILGSLDAGATEPLNPDLSFSEVAAVVGQSALYQLGPGGAGSPPVPRALFGRPPKLRRLK